MAFFSDPAFWTVSLFIALLALRVPIAVCIGMASIAVAWFWDLGLPMISYNFFANIAKYPLLAIPYFILAGNIMSQAGIAARIITFIRLLFGHLTGGLAIATVIVAAFWGAVSGSPAATVAALGVILIPAMVAQGYPVKFGTGVIATSGGLGILIPPSIVMVMYAVATSGMVVTGPDGGPIMSASIGTLFMAGVIPGLMLATMLGATTTYRAWKNDYPRMPRASWRERWRAFRESVWGLMLIVIIMGGIYGGIFTPTEAAAVSAVYAFVIAVWVYKDIRLREVPKVLLTSAAMSAMLLYIITNAVMFAFILTSEQIPQAVSAWIVDMGLGKIGFLMAVNIILLVIGMVMEPSAIILIMAPILFPVAMKLGVDPVHFGIMLVVNMEVGLCTPPVGLNLYVASSLSKLGLTDVTKATWPWLLTALIFLMLVTYIPDISLFLPRLLGMM
ncbi:TRAP transporter large permease subunit [Candidatus Falkowbacteria bacterium]|nr:TRAP transporter large permease subunit [Candidatus Falkowbacteria bacterium]